jgi:hypothetical protein
MIRTITIALALIASGCRWGWLASGSFCLRSGQ